MRISQVSWTVSTFFLPSFSVRFFKCHNCTCSVLKSGKIFYLHGNFNWMEKAIMWYVFHFIYYVLDLTTLNPIKVAKINLQWSCLAAILPCKQFMLERASMVKTKFKCLDGVFEMFCFLEILKICGFVFMKTNLILLQSWQNMPTYFAKLTLTRCFNSTSLFFNLTQVK